MKKKFIYLGMLSVAGLSIFSAYKDGPAAHGLGNRSGSQGSTNTCSTGSCHPAENTALNVNIILIDATTGVPVTDFEYVPGRAYKAVLSGFMATAPGTMTHFGYQTSVIDGSSATAGTFTASAGQSVQTPSGVALVEHTTPIAKSTMAYLDTILWTAPPAGTGTVDFHSRMLICNNNDNKSDDIPGSGVNSFDEKISVSIGQEDISSKFTLYPNPAKDKLTIALDKSEQGIYGVRIYDLQGKLVMQSSNDFSAKDLSIDTKGLSQGQYYILLYNAENKITKPFSLVK